MQWKLNQGRGSGWKMPDGGQDSSPAPFPLCTGHTQWAARLPSRESLAPSILFLWEWGYDRCWKHPMCMLGHFIHVQLFETPWTIACQAPLSMGLSWQEYWSGLPCPPPEDLPDSEMESMSLMSPTLAGGLFTTSATWEAQKHLVCVRHSAMSNSGDSHGL